MKVCVILALTLVALTSGNPAAGKKWHWKPLHPTRSGNPNGLNFDKFVKHEKPLNYVKGTTKVDNCGKAAVDNRIVGGAVATPHSWPWQVGLFIDVFWFCGGSLISDSWVMSAGHCTSGKTSFEVVMGAHDITINEPTQVTMVSTVSITHENYNSFLLHNDVGVIQLPSAVALTPEIQPVCLPSYSDTDLPGGVIVTPSGWGKIADSAGGITDLLRQVDVPTIDNPACAAVYGATIIDSIICTDATGGMGVCSGDSGGPLNYDDGSGTYCIRGVVSFTHVAGCESGNPSGYSRVTHFLQWIETNTGIIINP